MRGPVDIALVVAVTGLLRCVAPLQVKALTVAILHHKTLALHNDRGRRLAGAVPRVHAGQLHYFAAALLLHARLLGLPQPQLFPVLDAPYLDQLVRGPKFFGRIGPYRVSFVFNASVRPSILDDFPRASMAIQYRATLLERLTKAHSRVQELETLAQINT